MSTDDVSRRTFIRTAGGAAGVAGATAATAGTAAAQEEQPVWPSGAEGNGGEYQDARGESEVTVEVGAGDQGLAFNPTLLWVDTGTTVTFEWTGNGGAHNVQTVEDGGPAALDSGDPIGEEGETYEYETSEDDVGITHYHCVPHTTTGMHGGLAVGEDIETESTGGGGSDAVFVPQGARALSVATFVAMASTLGLAFVFMKYGGTITRDEE
ncbi:halocyanin domain-containing protein [Halorubrum lipolyticum]|uniref:Blue (Type 1) copper domain protein n=1 Tax=Halorubrum lipolyticum DSM 21995 TaxID=1227482 RepID=M0NXI0_9EURY|nr:halocyanin domain-containing protein [Halorubrum lipolyticum]EMA61964.1 blue (type 1) copper domain protein [Halorubrum lipolyticum DSM 21995]